jgi:hypothetical protein
LAILAAALPMRAGDAADGPIGTVAKVAPEAHGTPPGGARAVLGQNDPVVTDETVETSESGALHLRFIDESDLWVGANSELVLDKLVYDPAGAAEGAYAVQLAIGLFRFVTGKLDHGAYEVWTPTAVIGVRGTDFVVSVARSGSTRVTAYDGRLTVRPRLGGSTVSLGPPSTAMIARATGPVMASPFVDPVGAPQGSAEDRPLPALEILRLEGTGNVGGGPGAGPGAGAGPGGGTGPGAGGGNR